MNGQEHVNKVKDWLERCYYRILHGFVMRNRLNKSEWDGTVPEPQCCATMASAVAEGDSPIVYEPVFRRWRIAQLYYRNQTWQITHCPWCGNELASDLGEEWARRTEALGFTEGGHYSEVRGLPEEYRTDKWWKEADL